MGLSPRFFSPATLLIWCSHPAQMLQTLPPLPGCQHVPVVFSYLAVESECFASREVSKYLWYKGDYSGMNEKLADVDWESMFSNRSQDCGVMLQFVS